jgi:hypothetical protein
LYADEHHHRPDYREEKINHLTRPRNKVKESCKLLIQYEKNLKHGVRVQILPVNLFLYGIEMLLRCLIKVPIVIVAPLGWR